MTSNRQDQTTESAWFGPFRPDSTGRSGGIRGHGGCSGMNRTGYTPVMSETNEPLNVVAATVEKTEVVATSPAEPESTETDPEPTVEDTSTRLPG